jgi:hypothetical protein
VNEVKEVNELNEVTRARTVVGASAKAVMGGIFRDPLWAIFLESDKSAYESAF